MEKGSKIEDKEYLSSTTLCDVDEDWDSDTPYTITLDKHEVALDEWWMICAINSGQVFPLLYSNYFTLSLSTFTSAFRIIFSSLSLDIWVSKSSMLFFQPVYCFLLSSRILVYVFCIEALVAIIWLLVGAVEFFCNLVFIKGEFLGEVTNGILQNKAAWYATQ